jgi:hypothetical protein
MNNEACVAENFSLNRDETLQYISKSVCELLSFKPLGTQNNFRQVLYKS